jgi:outer membrane protein OmpA-like peptidoglycan-associated protein
MTFKLDGLSKSVARVAVVLVLAAGSSACSSVPGWVDPTSWFGDDQASNAPADEATAENSQTPDLADVPNKPAPASTADEQKQVADSLAADKARAQYSGDALRGGTEASAPPPPDAAPADQVADTSTSAANQIKGDSTPASTSDQPASVDNKTADSTDTAPAPAAPRQRPAYFGAPPPEKAPPPPQQAPQAVASMPGTLPAVAAYAPPPSAPATPAATPAPSAVADASSPTPAAPAAAPETKVAMAEPLPAATPAPGALPAVPANAGGAVTLGAMPRSAVADNLGFQRSSAPALDPSIGQFVSQPVMARYQQTASMSGSAGIQPTAMAAASPSGHRHLKSHATVAMGGPEQMSGAVVANFDSLQTASVAPSTPAVYSDAAGLPPTAVVFFPHDTTILSGEARTQVRAAVQAYQANGGQGFIRVVGHSSSGGESMSAQRRLIWNFERSQARAKAVAQELIREGIPADKVLVEAVGDQQPAAAQGEDGNRRAEIFLQS